MISEVFLGVVLGMSLSHTSPSDQLYDVGVKQPPLLLLPPTVAEVVDPSSPLVAVPSVDRQPFETAGINYIYSKCAKRYGGEELLAIKHALALFDETFSRLSKTRHDNDSEEEGEKMAYDEVEAQLRVYMRSIGHEDVLDAAIVKHQKYSVHSPLLISKTAFDTVRDELRRTTATPSVHLFADIRLDRMFVQAQQADFTEEELNQLKIQLTAYDTRMTAYRTKLMDLAHENSVTAVEVAVDDGANTQLKEDNKELADQLLVLKSMVSKGSNSTHGFSHPRVAALWTKVAGSELIDADQKVLLHAQLHNIQRRLNKLQWMQTVVETGGEGEKETKAVHTAAVKQHKPYDMEKMARKLKEATLRVDRLEAEVHAKLAAALPLHEEL